MKVLGKPTMSVDFTITVELSEQEIRALDGIFGYSVEHFLKVFYEKMGEAYVKPYEAGVRSLHKQIRGAMSDPIAAMDLMRRRMKTPHPMEKNYEQP